MVGVHGRRAQQLALGTRGLDPGGLIAVPIDVGKRQAAALVCEVAGELLARPFRFAMNRVGVAELIQRVAMATAGRPVGLVRVGTWAAGHYHQPLLAEGCCQLAGRWWEVNPAQVAAQRGVAGRRGSRPTRWTWWRSAICCVLGMARSCARPAPVMAWVGSVGGASPAAGDARAPRSRTSCWARSTGPFPGWAGASCGRWGARFPRLVLREFTDPGRLAGLDPAPLRAEAAKHGVGLHTAVAHCLVATARVALTSQQGAAARVVLAEDLGLLEALDEQVTMAEQRLDVLVARTPVAVLTTTPGWSTVRAAGYAAAACDLARWPSHRQVYRASGLPPVVYASAGQRRDGAISREGSVGLRRALLGLGVGLWRHDPPARAWAAQLRARGKAKGVIATALANRAGRIAFAMVRDQTAYQSDRSGVTGQHNGWSG